MHTPDATRGLPRHQTDREAERDTIGLLDDPLSLFADEASLGATPDKRLASQPPPLFADEAVASPRIEWQETRRSHQTLPLRTPRPPAVVRRGIDLRMLVLAAALVALAALGSVRACDGAVAAATSSAADR
jgi:hypothetical protein